MPYNESILYPNDIPFIFWMIVSKSALFAVFIPLPVKACAIPVFATVTSSPNWLYSALKSVICLFKVSTSLIILKSPVCPSYEQLPLPVVTSSSVNSLYA